MTKDFLSKNDVLIGAYVSHDQASQFSMAALSDGVNKSSLLKTLIENYLSEKDPKAMIQAIAYQAFIAWDSKKQKKSAKELSTYFENNVRPGLKRKHISEDYIIKIFKRIGELNASANKERNKKSE
jgi:transposase